MSSYSQDNYNFSLKITFFQREKYDDDHPTTLIRWDEGLQDLVNKKSCILYAG